MNGESHQNKARARVLLDQPRRSGEKSTCASFHTFLAGTTPRMRGIRLNDADLYVFPGEQPRVCGE